MEQRIRKQEEKDKTRKLELKEVMFAFFAFTFPLCFFAFYLGFPFVAVSRVCRALVHSCSFSCLFGHQGRSLSGNQ